MAAMSSSSESDSDEERPNRWLGAPSTWQDMNREEISTLTALNEIRNRDLSVHLYNAFALKQRHRRPNGMDGTVPVPEQDINAATNQPVQSDSWVPPRTWTAWPMSAAQVPADVFMKRTQDPDDKFTIRKLGREMPSMALEESVSASILRFAKERFESRPWEDAAEGLAKLEDNEDEDDSDGSSSVSSRPRSRSKSRSRAASVTMKLEGDDGMDIDFDDLDSDAESGVPPGGRILRPAVAVDDEMSYNLLRPSVRHILTKLDATLTVLHISRENVTNYQSDSSDASDASELSSRSRESSTDGSQKSGKRKRGRPRKPGVRKNRQIYDDSQGATTSQGESQSGRSKRKPGRPLMNYPRLEGETDRELIVRIARIQKKAIPIFSDEDSGDEAEVESENSMKASRVRRKVQRKIERQLSRDRSSDGSKESSARRGQMRGLALRDWQDVLGAAAVAGFPPGALDRAARRCAELFGQSMELRTLTEGPPSQDQGNLDKVVRYRPGMAAPEEPDEESDDDEDDDEWETQSRIKRHVRSSSVVSEDDSRGRSRSASRSRSRATSRSRSRSVSAPGSHFCRVRGCPRATEGFSRSWNLRRHVKEVHGDEAAEEVDSEDEMEGAVHVDGFLRPVRIRRGWRAENLRRGESSRGVGRGRKRYRSDDGCSFERGRSRRHGGSGGDGGSE